MKENELLRESILKFKEDIKQQAQLFRSDCKNQQQSPATAAVHTTRIAEQETLIEQLRLENIRQVGVCSWKRFFRSYFSELERYNRKIQIEMGRSPSECETEAEGARSSLAPHRSRLLVKLPTLSTSPPFGFYL